MILRSSEIVEFLENHQQTDKFVKLSVSISQSLPVER